MKSKIPNIRNELWNELIEYFKNDYPNTNKVKFHNIISIMGKNSLISDYQWAFFSNKKDNLLNDLLRNFFIKIRDFKIKHLDKKDSNGKKTVEFSNSIPLFNYFKEQFQIFEEKILLSKYYAYLILIPTFGIFFPENVDILNLDSSHLIRNIKDIDFPYGNTIFINKFKETPESWEGNTYNKVSASFEIKIKIKKRLKSDQVYDARFLPLDPSTSYEYNIFDDKVRSIYDFFHIFNLNSEISPLSFSNRYYLKLPPFSQYYDYSSQFLHYEFPPPRSYLDIETLEKREWWKKCWISNYDSFHKNYYTQKPESSKYHIFRYSLEVLRYSENIKYPPIRNFMLVSTLESLLFDDKIKKLLIKIDEIPSDNSKSKTVAQVFAQISETEKKKWYLFKEPKSDEFNYTKEDLIDFIISTFQYRNQIAHPAKQGKIKFKPRMIYKYKSPPSSSDEYHLEFLISKWFPIFLKFLLNLWLKSSCRTTQDWYKLIKTKFKDSPREN